MPKKKNASSLISELKRKTRRNYSSKEKIRSRFEQIFVYKVCNDKALGE